MDRRLAAALLVLVLSQAHAGPNRTSAAQTDPAAIGAAEIVLPGFAPLRGSDRRVELGAGRLYEWTDGLLPARTESRGSMLTGPLTLVVREAGVARVVTARGRKTLSSSAHHMESVVTGGTSDLEIEARIHVDYDGLATVDLRLVPHGSVHIDGMEIAASIARSAETRLLAFSPSTIWEFKKQVVFPVCTDASYKSVLAITDTDRAFWLLTDEPAIPSNDPRWQTQLACERDSVQLRQPLLPNLELNEPLELRFAFMATPVRDLPATFRQDRVIPNLVRDEVGLGDRLLWWIDAFPHYALPFTDYPPGARERLSPADVAAYPGLEANRRSLESTRAMGIERMPYMTLRCPSTLDPVVEEHLADWRVQPPMAFKGAESPYQQGVERPLLSHRGRGFSDYLLMRLDAVLAALPVRGFYLDQSEPIGSANPAQMPADPRVRPTMATDILAIHSFYQRLATAIYQRSRAPLIYVHNSMATVVPAYSFVTAMVQGEEFADGLRNLDYQQSADLEMLQTTFTNGASGVPVIWLEECWSPHQDSHRPSRYRGAQLGAWLRSPEYETCWRNFMSLALLHDDLAWTLAPPPLRKALYAELDRFGVGAARFTGYWKLDSAWRSHALLASLYSRPDGRVLAVIVNRGSETRVISAADLAPYRFSASAKPPTDAASAAPVGRSLQAGDFLLAELN